MEGRAQLSGPSEPFQRGGDKTQEGVMKARDGTQGGRDSGITSRRCPLLGALLRFQIEPFWWAGLSGPARWHAGGYGQFTAWLMSEALEVLLQQFC